MSVYYKERPDYLICSIESMINQTKKPDEIVIVKDGELTEELNKVINDFVNMYPGLFTIVCLKNNVGLGLALNEGLKICRNELVARMDTDDISLSTRCELQLKEFERDSDLSIVGTMINEFYDNPSNQIASRIVPTEHNEIVKFSRRRNPFNHPTVMYKKSDVLRCGGYHNYRRNQDFDLFVRMLDNGCKAKNINKSLLLFRANRDNLKRRKSWEKVKSNIQLIYNFWQKGHSGFIDFLVISSIQIIVYISPIWLFDWISKKFLRKSPYSN